MSETGSATDDGCEEKHEVQPSNRAGNRNGKRASMVAIVPGTLRDIAYVAANLRPQDRRELKASADLASTVEAAVIAHGTSANWCWTAQIAGQPIAAFGVAETSPLTPHLRSAWAFGTSRFRRAVPAISRFAAREWPRRLSDENVHRLEVRSLADHDIAHNWLAGLGARLEGELHALGTRGETFQLWAWTADPARRA